MGYYETKRILFASVDKMIKEGTFSKEDISFGLMRATGFGEKVILKYIEDGTNKGFFKEENGKMMSQ